MEKNLFNEMIGALCVTFNRELNEPLVSAYNMALSDYEERDLIRAGAELMKGEYFPKPFDFIQLLEPRKPLPRDAANSAWSDVKHWAWEKGAPPSPMAFRAMRGVCDKFMLERADQSEITSYGFAFRSNFEILLAEEEAEENRAMIEGGTPDKMIGAEVDPLDKYRKPKELGT